MVLICRASLKLHIREKPLGREAGRRRRGVEGLGGGRTGRGWREKEEEAAAVLELMSACQIRNTMHLRQKFAENREGMEGKRKKKKKKETDI